MRCLIKDDEYRQLVVDIHAMKLKRNQKLLKSPSSGIPFGRLAVVATPAPTGRLTKSGGNN